jgi:hypothetical protein
MLPALKMLSVAGLAMGGASLALGADASGLYDLAGKPAWQAVLSDELAEISGLAFAPDGRLFAHGDEQGVVHRLDPRSGKILGNFGLETTGDEPDLGKKRKGTATGNAVVGDFEGIAIAGDRFFLVTSNGVLAEFKEGHNGSRVRYTAHATGLEPVCEIEGVDHDASAGDLLLLCKDSRGKARMTEVRVYAWSVRSGRLDPKPRLVVPYRELARFTGASVFNGSAIAVTPGGKSFVLLAGPQQTFAEIGRDGRVLRGGAFPRGLQRQPEGAAFAPDGTLLIASEAAGQRATLSGYLPLKR